jgi:mitochondrial import inner membrane translocase subunit TIM21
VRRDKRVIAALGGSSKDEIRTYGEATWNRWARNRALAAREETDKLGAQHLRMEFNVEGTQRRGRVHMHMSKKPSQTSYEYRYLFVDVPGHQRIYLENADEKKGERPSGRILGFKFW